VIRALLLALWLLAGTACAATPAVPGADAPGEVDYTCKVDADCAVKDVGNCCGYYPACVNRDSPTFPEQVKAQCEKEGRMAICGFPSVSGCRCVEGRCQNVTGPAAEAASER